MFWRENAKKKKKSQNVYLVNMNSNVKPFTNSPCHGFSQCIIAHDKDRKSIS